jgi:putative multiple sugar transport system permease protein
VIEKIIALKQTPRHAGVLKNNLRDYGMLISLFAIMAFFEVVTDGTLLRPLNLTNLVLQNSYIVIMALGMLLVIVTGHIDLSVGSVAGFVGAVAAVLIVQFDVHYVPAALICLALGAAIGAAQGYWAGRHVGIQRSGAGHPQREIGRPISGRVPAAVVRVHP